MHRPGGEARGDSDNRWRLFVAIFPSREAQAAAARATEALRSPGDGVAWVKPGNLHYTLRFLGDLGPDGATRAAEAAREAAADHEPFGAALGAFGVFPSARRARVLWVGLTEGDEQMRLLAASLEASLVRHGFGEADKPFEPHLTVGRLRVPGDWMAKLVAARAVEARFTVDQVVLIRSVLSPGGSLYKVVGEAWLGAGGE